MMKDDLDPTLDEPMLSSKEVARFLGVSQITIIRWAESGKLSAFWLSRRCIRFLKRDVEKFLADMKEKGAARPRKRGRKSEGKNG